MTELEKNAHTQACMQLEQLLVTEASALLSNPHPEYKLTGAALTASLALLRLANVLEKEV